MAKTLGTFLPIYFTRKKLRPRQHIVSYYNPRIQIHLPSSRSDTDPHLRCLVQALTSHASHTARVGLGRSLRSQSWRMASFSAALSWSRLPQRVCCSFEALRLVLPVFDSSHCPCRSRRVMRVRWQGGPTWISSTAVGLARWWEIFLFFSEG